MDVKTKKRITAAVGWLALLLMLGLAGGCEMGWIPTCRGAALAAVCELVWISCMWKVGWLTR